MSSKQPKSQPAPMAVPQVVTFGPSFDLFDDLRPPVSPAKESAFREALRTAKQRVADTYRGLKLAELKAAEAESEITEARWRALAERRDRERQRLEALPAGRALAGAAALGAFAACMTAEYVFNLAVLPWFLDLSPESVVAQMLAVAPATALLILELALPRLFGLEDLSGRAARAYSEAAATARRILAALFWLAVAGTTLASLYFVAKCREVATQVSVDRTVTTLSPQARDLLQHTVIVLSVVLAVNGALFYLFGRSELGKAWERRRARRRLHRLEELAEETFAAHRRAVRDLELKREASQAAEQGAQQAAEVFEARSLLRLVQMLEEHGKPASAWEKVQAMILARSL
jgi:hypothetical protein